MNRPLRLLHCVLNLSTSTSWAVSQASAEMGGQHVAWGGWGLALEVC